jgi:uncharacterized protein (TIGR03437 family)
MKTATFALLIYSQLIFYSQPIFAASPGSLRDRAKPYLDRALDSGQSFVVVSSASGTPVVASDSDATALGPNLASQTASGTAPYPTTLGGVTVNLLDTAGTVYMAPLFYVSPTQINFLVPPGIMPGSAVIVISAGGGNSLTSTMQALAAAPALFTANQNGSGVVAATAYRQVLSTHISSPVPVFQCQDPTVGCVSVPIQLGVDTPVFVTFNATGLRGRSGDAGVQLTVAGQQMSIQSITALDDNGAAPGVDQLLVPIPLSLRGAGEVDVTVAVDGKVSNIGRINIQ